MSLPSISLEYTKRWHLSFTLYTSRKKANLALKSTREKLPFCSVFAVSEKLSVVPFTGVAGTALPPASIRELQPSSTYTGLRTRP